MSGVRSKICGVGINDANYLTTVHGWVGERRKTLWKCPYYKVWCSMLRRCYSEKVKIYRPSYAEVTCCEEWLLFSNFKRWMEQQDWEGKALDKDLRVYQNKIYSPETCCFVDVSINSFLVTNRNKRGKYPLGVTYAKKCSDMINEFKKPYRSSCGKTNLGRFSNPLDAHKAWQEEKCKQAVAHCDVAQDRKVKEGLLRVYSKIKLDFDNNRETLDF